MRSETFFAELTRRSVSKAAVAYAIGAWLLVRVAARVTDVPTDNTGGAAHE